MRPTRGSRHRVRPATQNHDGTADNRDDASQRASHPVQGLGYGTYTVTETKEPAGYASYAKPTFTVTIDDAGTSIQYRVRAPCRT